MIELTQLQKELLAQEPLEVFVLVKIHTVRLTSYEVDVKFFNEIYTASDLIFETDPVKMISNVERDLYGIKVVDSKREIISQLDQTIYGSPVELRLVPVDNKTNQPVLEANYLLYGGVFESYTADFDMNEVGSINLTIRCSNMMSSLDKIKVFHSTRNDLAELDPTDSAFNQIHNGAVATQIRWGRSE